MSLRDNIKTDDSAASDPQHIAAAINSVMSKMSLYQKTILTARQAVLTLQVLAYLREWGTVEDIKLVDDLLEMQIGVKEHAGKMTHGRLTMNDTIKAALGHAIEGGKDTLRSLFGMR